MLTLDCRRVFVGGWRPSGNALTSPRVDTSLYVPFADSPSTFDDLADVVDYEAVYRTLRQHPFLATRGYCRAVSADLLENHKIVALRMTISSAEAVPIDGYFMRGETCARVAAAIAPLFMAR